MTFMRMRTSICAVLASGAAAFVEKSSGEMSRLEDTADGGHEAAACASAGAAGPEASRRDSGLLLPPGSATFPAASSLSPLPSSRVPGVLRRLLFDSRVPGVLRRLLFDGVSADVLSPGRFGCGRVGI